MDPKFEYMSENNALHANFLRNSRAIAVVWGVFTICFAIISTVVFMQPHWISDTQDSPAAGHFGLWTACRQSADGNDLVCKGRLDDFDSIVTPAFKVATVFMAMSTLLTWICVASFIFFFFCRGSSVFQICGWMQLLSAICLSVAVLAYPAGWDHEEVRAVCGERADDYALGDCWLRWSYILAIVALVDCNILCIMAFSLSSKNCRFEMTEAVMAANGSIYKGEMNSAFLGDTQSLASRKSLPMQPVVLVPQPIRDPDRMSQFSQRTGRSKTSHYTASMHNFQL